MIVPTISIINDMRSRLIADDADADAVILSFINIDI